jgi:hypothetical protein
MTGAAALAAPTLEELLKLARRGLPIFPCHNETLNGCSCGDAACDSPGKHPRTSHGCKDATTDESLIEHWFNHYPVANWAVATGRDSKIFVLDFDPGSEKTLAAWDAEHGSDWSKTLCAGTPRDGFHAYYRHPDLLEGFKIKSSVKSIAPGVDVRGDGGYVVLPPSRLRNGAYTWLNDLPIADAPLWVLQKVVVATQLVEIHGENEENDSTNATGDVSISAGERNSTLASLAGTMRRRGMSPAAISAALMADNIARCQPPLDSDEVEKIARNISGYPTESENPWPDPTPIACTTVEPFSLDLIPSSLRPQVEDTSERMQVPPDFPAAVSIVALAGCAGRRAMVQPKQIDFSWEMPVNLWGMVVGQPGLLKSPSITTIMRPLVQIEQQWQETNKLAMQHFEIRNAQRKIEQEIWSRDYKKACETGAHPPDERPAAEEPPPQKRLLLGDATSEKTHELMLWNPGGLLMVRDELASFIAGLDKTGRELDRGFYLQAWSGDTGFTMDRIARGSVFVPHVCLSLFGAIQPGRIAQLLADQAGPNADGLIQRFQVMVYPDMRGDWHLIDRRPNAQAHALAHRVFAYLAELPCDPPLRLKFAAAAQELFDAWLTTLEHELRSPGNLAPVVITHLAKYRGLVPRLAALYELCDRVANGECFASGQNLEITPDHTAQAIAVSKYLRSHAMRVYAGLNPQESVARDLSEKLRQGKLSNPFSTRTLYRKCWAGTNTPTSARQVLEFLASLGWLRSVATTESREGRPAEVWAINPKVVSA